MRLPSIFGSSADGSNVLILCVLPAIVIAAKIVLAARVRYRRDGSPFYMVCLIFIAAFGTLAIQFSPCDFFLYHYRGGRRVAFEHCLDVLGNGQQRDGGRGWEDQDFRAMRR